MVLSRSQTGAPAVALFLKNAVQMHPARRGCIFYRRRFRRKITRYAAGFGLAEWLRVGHPRSAAKLACHLRWCFV
jgi:hypothetical protein